MGESEEKLVGERVFMERRGKRKRKRKRKVPI